MTDEFFILLSIIFLLLCCIAHSVAGEAYLLRPLFKYRGNNVLDHPLARLVLRFAWHVTSIMWLLLAYLLYQTAILSAPTQETIVFGVGWTFTAIGLFDLVVSKGRHIGWPLLLGAGVAALLAYY